MTMTDPIADMLPRIRNANTAGCIFPRKMQKNTSARLHHRPRAWYDNTAV